MNMKQAMRDFEAHLAVERNLSPYTRKNYLIDLRQFRDFLGNSDVSGRGDDEKILQIDHLMIRSFLGSLYRKKVKKVTLGRKVAALRTFFNYLLREGKVKINPADMVQAPRAEKYIPTFLSVDEVMALLAVHFSQDFPGIPSVFHLSAYPDRSLSFQNRWFWTFRSPDHPQKSVHSLLKPGQWHHWDGRQ